ncbi:MAG: helix-turn-helix transcriptional regulator [Gemmatimonadaceae bacterium]
MPRALLSGVDVIAYLSPLLLMQLRVVLGQSHRLLPVADWRQLDLTVRRTVVDVAVLDPLADGSDGTAAVRAFQQRHPSVPLVLYIRLSPDSLRSVVALAHLGQPQVVLYRFDDEPERFRQLLERQPHERFAESLLERLEPALARLSVPMAGAVRLLFRQPHRIWSAQDLATAAGCPRRSLYRQLEAAGFNSPRQLVQAARLLRAFVYLKDPGNLIEDVVAKLRYGSSHVFIRHTRETCDITPSALRDRVDGQTLVERLAERLVGIAREAGAGSSGYPTALEGHVERTAAARTGAVPGTADPDEDERYEPRVRS